MLIATVAVVGTWWTTCEPLQIPPLKLKMGTLFCWCAFSKKSLVRKMLAFGFDINQRYGVDKITPTDVGEEDSGFNTCALWASILMGIRPRIAFLISDK